MSGLVSLRSSRTAARGGPQVVGNMLRIRTLVMQHIAKQDEEKTTDFLCEYLPLACLPWDCRPIMPPLGGSAQLS